jgi:hypothetical protein
MAGRYGRPARGSRTKSERGNAIARWAGPLVPNRANKKIADLGAAERVEVAKEQTRRLVDLAIELVALPKTNRIVGYSPRLATPIPRSFAAHAFNHLHGSYLLAPRMPAHDRCQGDAVLFDHRKYDPAAQLHSIVGELTDLPLAKRLGSMN